MQEDFKPPKTDEEFERRAKSVTTEGAIALVRSLKSRRAALVRAVDEEIAFYERIVSERKTGQ